MNDGEEPLAEALLLRFVPHGGVKHLSFRIRMEADRCHASAEYALAKTSAASRNSTEPSSISRQRFLSSSLHAEDRASPGLASRLSIRRSATKARACGDSDMASKTIFSAVALMLEMYGV